MPSSQHPSGQLSCAARTVVGGATARLAAEAGTRVVGAWPYPVRDGTPSSDGGVALVDRVQEGSLEWSAPDGEWFVALVFARLAGVDPV